jgi:gas vesicle protein
MKKEKGNNSSKVVAAFLVGALVGSLLGVLFAPARGSVTREKLVSRPFDPEADLRKKMKEDAEVIGRRAKQMEHYTHDKSQNRKNN